MVVKTSSKSLFPVRPPSVRVVTELRRPLLGSPAMLAEVSKALLRIETDSPNTRMPPRMVVLPVKALPWAAAPLVKVPPRVKVPAPFLTREMAPVI